MASVIVIGGGLAGLAAAIRLAERGVHVTLLERHPRLGGRATSYVLPGGECIDNCQHVTLGCCTALADFYERIGVADKIKFYETLVFGDCHGRRATMGSSALPAPFHLSLSFGLFPFLSWSDKLGIARAMLRIYRSKGEAPSGVTILDWLKKARQTPNAIDRFWRVVLVSALNEELDSTAAIHGIAVFWKAFLSSRTGYRIGIPTVPLEHLYSPAADFIRRRGGDVHLRCGVAELLIERGRASGVRLEDGSVLTADFYIAALPSHRLLKILPSGIRALKPFVDLQGLQHSPITSVHMWFDRPVMKEPFIASVDQTIQWVFNKGEGYIQIVISASHALIGRPQEEVLDLCRKQLSALIPASKDAVLSRAIVIRESSATFSPSPESERVRPGAVTPISNLFLAGDWVQTGWPATMEGAVRSGYAAADFVE